MVGASTHPTIQRYMYSTAEHDHADQITLCDGNGRLVGGEGGTELDEHARLPGVVLRPAYRPGAPRIRGAEDFRLLARVHFVSALPARALQSGDAVEPASRCRHSRAGCGSSRL